MTLQQFISKYTNKTVDFDGHYGGQCVDLVRQYWQDVIGLSKQPKGVVGAKDFWTNYDRDPVLNENFVKVKNTPSGVPEAGDIMIWGARYGQYGHIAIVTWADVNSFAAFSQNDPIGSRSIKRKYANYKGVLGWFKPKQPTSTKPLKDTVIDFDDSEGKRHTVGWYVREWDVEKQRAEEAEERLEQRDQEHAAELQEVREKSVQEVSQLNNKVRELQSELVQCKDMAKTKTLTQHVESGAKYSGSSVVLGASTAKILAVFFPETEAIQVEIAGVATFIYNLLLVGVFKNS